MDMLEVRKKLDKYLKENDLILCRGRGYVYREHKDMDGYSVVSPYKVDIIDYNDGMIMLPGARFNIEEGE